MGEGKLQLNEMNSKVTIMGVKSIVWFFNKSMRHALQGLHVDVNSLNRVKSLLTQNYKVILMPIYKSFIDPFLNIFIHNHFKLDAPFIFGNMEDTPQIKLFSKWLKAAGYIYSHRSYNQSL